MIRVNPSLQALIHGKSKYLNKKTDYDGYSWDSNKELQYYKDLKLRLAGKNIQSFDVKPNIELQPSFDLNGEHIRAIVIRPDFKIYHHDGTIEFVDVKGMNKNKFFAKGGKRIKFPTRTADWEIKWKMLKFQLRNEAKYRFTVC